MQTSERQSYRRRQQLQATAAAAAPTIRPRAPPVSHTRPPYITVCLFKFLVHHVYQACGEWFAHVGDRLTSSSKDCMQTCRAVIACVEQGLHE
eukprot:15471234-Alexandrium_andersonii.AAC.1